MSDNLRKSYIDDISRQLSSIVSSSQFEQLGYILLQHITGNNKLLNHRGQNIKGEPVGYTVDSYSSDITLIGEYGIDKDYFNNLKKPLHDIEHAVKISNNKVKYIYLFSSQECTEKKGIELSKICNDYLLKNIKIEWFDSRKIATYIIDNMINFDIAKEKLIEFIPVLDRIFKENCLNYSLPETEVPYVCDSFCEHKIWEQLCLYRHVLIHGISGVGKSLIALNIAINKKKEFDLVIWIDEDNTIYKNSMKDIFIKRAGFNYNLYGLIKQHKVLIIIDDIKNEIKEVLNLLIQDNDNCYVLLTSQIEEKSVQSRFPMHFPNNEICNKILNMGIEEHAVCPKDIYESIVSKTSGLPILLAIINKMVTVDNLTWSEVKDDLKFVPNFEDNKGQIICNRIIERHLKTIKNELQAIKWLDSKYIQRDMLIHLIGNIGLKKLKERGLINLTDAGTIKIHDIIFLSILQTDVEVKNYYKEFIKFFEEKYSVKDEVYFKAIHIHKKKIIKNYKKSKSFGIDLYLYLLGDRYDSEGLVKNIDIEYIKKHIDSRANLEYFDLISIFELFECKYLLIKKTKGIEQAKEYLVKPVKLLEGYLERIASDDKVYLDLLHHMGKFYNNCGNSYMENAKDKALACYEKVISSNPLAYETKLQIARLLKNTNLSRSEQLLMEIVEAYKNDPKAISISVVLATYEEFRKKEYYKLQKKYVFEDIELFKNLIIISANESYDQPFRVLAGMGKTLSFKEPRFLIKIMDVLPIPTVDSVEKNSSFSIAELFKETGKSISREENDVGKSTYYYKQAESFYINSEMVLEYNIRMHAENYILLNRGLDAFKILNNINKSEWNAFTYYRAAQALRIIEQKVATVELGINNLYKLNVDMIDKAISLLTEKQMNFRSSFYNEKGKVLYKYHMPEYKEAYKMALQYCDDDDYKKQIEKELIGLHE